MCLSDHLGFLLALLLDIVDHPLQFGALLVHLLQALLGNLLLGLQVLQAAAFSVQAVLHVLFTKADINIHTLMAIGSKGKVLFRLHFTPLLSFKLQK